MERASTAMRSWVRQRWSPVWRRLRGQLAPVCAYAQCGIVRRAWRRRPAGVRMRGMEYCRIECLELALVEILGQTQARPGSVVPASHRIPLGLLLLSRQQLTAEQLRAALEAQKNACGEAKPKKIGVWLQDLGFTSEPEITAALARQWACPVLRSAPMDVAASRFPSIPTLLLESYQMFPVELVETTRTLLMAFSERIDYTVLYAIEQMLRCRTQACVLSPSIMRKSLDMVAQRGGADVVFDRMESTGECARIIGSYTAKVKAEEVRMSRCGEHLWIRLERLRQQPVTLVLRAPFSSSQFSKPSSQFSVPSSRFSIRTEASGT
jgi:Type II secretion system (T2SS), protein E, N-terminal domain